MKSTKFNLLLLISIIALIGSSADECKSQDSIRYHYVTLHYINGMKVEFRFDSKNLALEKECEALKLKNIIDAVYLLEDKGWQLINFTSSPVGVGGFPLTSAFLKKKR